MKIYPYSKVEGNALVSKKNHASLLITDGGVNSDSTITLKSFTLYCYYPVKRYRFYFSDGNTGTLDTSNVTVDKPDLFDWNGTYWYLNDTLQAVRYLRFELKKAITVDSVMVVYFRNTDVHNIPFTIGNTGFATFYSKYQPYLLPEGLVAKTYVQDGDSLTVSSTRETGNGTYAFIPQDCPVVIHGDPGVHYIRYTVHSGLERPENSLRGCDDATTVTADDGQYLYKLCQMPDDTTSVGFFWDSTDGKTLNCSPNKAYLVMDKTQIGGNAKSLVRISGTGRPSSIDFVPSEDDKPGVSPEYYDLNGVKTEKPAKGLYIIKNGHKTRKGIIR